MKKIKILRLDEVHEFTFFYSLNIQKALIHVSHQNLKYAKLLINPLYLDIIIQYQIYEKVKQIL